MVVALGTLVYGFASTAFGGFGAGFSNLVQSAGAQLEENVQVEQIYFFNSINNSASCAPNPPFSSTPATCGGVMYVRNVGANPVILQTIYMVNVTRDLVLTTATSANCFSNSLAYGTVCFTTFDSATGSYDTNILPMSSSDQIDPGKVLAIYFVLPTDEQNNPSCAPGPTATDCAVVHGGSVYSFTIVTSRGNNFVAYAKA